MDSCGKLPCTPELVNGVRKADVEQAFANLSLEDQAYMLEIYQDDIFMNE